MGIPMPEGWGLITDQADRQTKAEPADQAKKKGDPRRKQTLRRAYNRILKPRMQAEQAKRASFSPYVTAINHWERYWLERSDERRARRLKLADEPSVRQTDAQKTQAKKRIADPPIHRISKAHLEGFRRWILPGKAAVTVNNLVAKIRTLILAADEAGWREERPPKLRRLKARNYATKLVMTDDDLTKLYRAADGASWPARDRMGREVNPGDQWRAAIVMFSCYGFRTQELIRYCSWKRSLSWANVLSQSVSPGLSEAVNDDGWLCYVPEKQEGAKPEQLVLAIPDVVRLHLRRLGRSGTTDDGVIFDWPLSRRSQDIAFRGICLRAGVRPPVATGCSRFLIKHFRKTATTRHNLQTPGIAPHVLGHAPRNVSERHYNNPEQAVANHLAQWQYPPVFDDVRKTNQGLLF